MLISVFFCSQIKKWSWCLNCCVKSSYIADKWSKDANLDCVPLAETSSRTLSSWVRFSTSMVTQASHKEYTNKFFLSKWLPTLTLWHFNFITLFLFYFSLNLLTNGIPSCIVITILQNNFASQNKEWAWLAFTRELASQWLLKMFPWSFGFLLQWNKWFKKLAVRAFMCGAPRELRILDLSCVSATMMPFPLRKRTKFLVCTVLINEMVMAN